MDAGVEVQLSIVVAVAAVDSFKDIFVREVLDVGVFVAIDAFELAVNGLEEDGLVDKE